MKKLKIVTFKGLRNITVNLSESSTIIEGGNNTGKTTIVDAYNWLLFGKDSQDRADFAVWPRTDNPSHVEVEGIWPGFKLRRELHQRKDAEGNVVGYETRAFIDDVPVKVADYQNFIQRNFPAEWAKILSSPEYFATSLHWEKRRSLLQKIADVDSLEKALREKYTGGKDPEKEAIALASQRKRLIDAIEEVRIRKDEAITTVTVAESPETVQIQLDRLELEQNEALKDTLEEITHLEAQRREVVKTAYDSNSKRLAMHRKSVEAERAKIALEVEAAEKKRAELREKKDDLRRQIETLKADAQNTYDAMAAEYRRQKSTLELERANIRHRIASLEQSLEGLVIRKCPLGGECPIDEKFADAVAKLAKLSDEITQLTGKLAGIENEIAGLVPPVMTPPDVSELEAQIAELSAQLASIYVPTLTLPMAPELESPDTAELDGRIRDLRLAIAAVEEANRCKRDDLVRRLEMAHAAERTKRRIDELDAQMQTLRRELAVVEAGLATIDQYEREFYTAVEERVNSLFHTAEGLSIKMFRQLLNGKMEPNCELYVDNVPWLDVNHARRVNVGLQIVATLQRHSGVHMPVWVDNAESCEQIPTPEGLQVVQLRVAAGLRQLKFSQI